MQQLIGCTSRLLYADSRQNAVFVRRSLSNQQVTGACLLGTYGESNSFIGLAKGSKRDGEWFYLLEGTGKSIQWVVLVESPIDAISQRTLDQEPGKNTQNTMYLAADGVSELLLEQLRQVPEVIVAFDNNLTGEQLAQKVLRHLPQASRYMPQGKDSNEALGKELNDFAARIAQVCQEQQAQVNRQKAIKQKPKRSEDLEL